MLEHPETENPGFDAALDALREVERRRILVALLDGDPIREGELPSIAGDDGRDPAPRVRTYHVHLPKLEEHGFVDWDRERDRVHRGSCFDAIAPLVELLSEHEEELPEGFT